MLDSPVWYHEVSTPAPTTRAPAVAPGSWIRHDRLTYIFIAVGLGIPLTIAIICCIKHLIHFFTTTHQKKKNTTKDESFRLDGVMSPTPVVSFSVYPADGDEEGMENGVGDVAVDEEGDKASGSVSPTLVVEQPPLEDERSAKPNGRMTSCSMMMTSLQIDLYTDSSDIQESGTIQREETALTTRDVVPDYLP